jgi:hypothetical protein
VITSENPNAKIDILFQSIFNWAQVSDYSLKEKELFKNYGPPDRWGLGGRCCRGAPVSVSAKALS